MRLRTYSLCGVAGVLMSAVSMGRGQTTETPEVEKGTAETASTPAATIPTANETASRTIEDGGTGPYRAVLVADSSLATHTIFRPRDLSAFGEKEKLPIIAWGNGACANSCRGYHNFLSEVASHGFLVIAIGPPQQTAARRGGTMGGGGMMGAGGSTKSSQLTEAIDWAIAQNGNKESLYCGKIDAAKTAVAGHSCGGLQAIEVSTDPRISTTMMCNSGIFNPTGRGGGMRGRGRAGARGGGGTDPGEGAGPGDGMRGGAGAGAGMGGGARAGADMGGGARAGEGTRGGAGAGARGRAGGGMMMAMPSLGKEYLEKLHAPILYLLGGEGDMAYPNGADDFRRVEKLPAFMASMDVGHGGTYGRPHGGEFAVVAVAWLKWQLKGDAEAAKTFTGDPCGLSKSADWEVEKKNIP